MSQNVLFIQIPLYFRFAPGCVCSLTHLCCSGDTWRGMIERCYAHAHKWRRMHGKTAADSVKLARRNPTMDTQNDSETFKIKPNCRLCEDQIRQ